MTTIPCNATANNGGSVNWGLFFDLTSSGGPITVTELRTASTAAAGPPVEFEVLTGNPGSMAGTGSATVANNDLTLVASDLPLNSFGFFLTSTTQGMVHQPGGSQGVLCLGGSIGRYVGAGQIKNSGATGRFDLLLDLTQTPTPTPTGFVAVMAGDTRNFQAWYRDAVGGVPTSNFTDGLEVTFN